MMRSVFDVESARLLHAKHITVTPVQQVPYHAHPHLECVYFLRGSGVIRLSSNALHSHEYCLAVYPPGLLHAERADPLSEEIICLGMTAPAAYPLGSHVILPDPLGKLRWLCQGMADEYEQAGVTRLAEAYLRTFLLLLERVWEAGMAIKHDAVNLVAQYLHANYAEDVTLKKLAQVACLSERHLRKRFVSRLGISPMRYLKQVRIEEAERLLASTNLEVKEIAAKVGFREPLHLTRVIKRTTGLCPTSFRHRQQEHQDEECVFGGHSQQGRQGVR